ncbi:MAG: chromosome segregation protein SMC [Anaerolineae bacterium]|nr:MAG: chromosome segregation protein SMC [Anaerolineae bacterium]
MSAARLKSLELVGYKTFASKTKFEFADQVTAVVGPNGSGKSNVADALRWVLGEQSYSLMRARKTDDIIFSGSEKRPRASMASATVTFDNSEGWLPIDFSEVSITRRAFRDGQNEYMINSQKVRLRDVTELLAKSGLAERTYTVIGQGMVDAALSLKAEDRRALFEEAAGISLYRQRREQSLRRLETTRRNLERVEDILAELAPRVKSLERQAQRAGEYEQVRADLQAILREWYGYHWHLGQQEYLDAVTYAGQQEQSLMAARENQEALDHDLLTLRDRISGLRARLGSWHRELAALHTRRESTSRELAVSDERQRALRERQTQLDSDLAQRQQELALEKERLQEAEVRVARLEADATEAQTQADAARITLAERQTQRTTLETELAETRKKLEQGNTRKIELAALKSELQARLDKQGGAQHDVSAEVGAAAVALEAVTLALSGAQTALTQAETARANAQNRLEQARVTLKQIEEQHRQDVAERARLETEAARLNAQLDVLVQAEESLAGYASGAKALLEATRSGRLAGGRGALSSHLTVPPEYETAIAAALGQYVDAVLVQGDYEPALALLEAEPARAAILPLDTLNPPTPLTAPNVEGCLGVAARLVSAPPELRPAVDLLLGQALVVKDRGAARRALAGQPVTARAVTLRGEVFAASGAILVDSEASAATLSRPRQRQELQELIEKNSVAQRDATNGLRELEGRRKTQEQELADAERGLKAAEQAASGAMGKAQESQLQQEAAQRQLDWQRGRQTALQQELDQAASQIKGLGDEAAALDHDMEQLNSEQRARVAELAGLTLDEPQAQAAHWDTQAAVSRRALEDARASQRERSDVYGRVLAQVTELQAGNAQVQEELTRLRQSATDMRDSEGGLGGEIGQLQELIEPGETELRAAEGQQAELEGRDMGSRQALNAVERAHAQAQIQLARRQEALDGLRRRIEDDFGLVEFTYEKQVSGPTPLPLGDLVERLPVVQVIAPDLEDRLKQQRMQLRRMGAVNPEAQAEYRQVKERFVFMTGQVADLTQAEKDIKEVIAELDELMDREFRKTFDTVAAEFREIFARLFPGGQARLLLTESEDGSDIGIDIEARLPGKRMQRLALLSGGERSLTAVSLVFALLKASPTPFCVMDEVDAALDEANVDRLRDLLVELSHNTQFVLITHNRTTVQAADVIYGITMGRDTTSQSISLRLDQVDETYA